MEFDTQKKEYSLGEFYKLYQDKLPALVEVKQGFCGEILAETFDIGQVIRINSICKQRRIIAVRLNERGTEECTYSFPVDYPIEFCLDDGLYEEESYTLTEILSTKKFPINVQFARKQYIKVGGNMSSTNHFSNLRLTSAFDEIYLLGNFLLEGEMVPQIVQVPLYLSAIRISEVTGLKGKSSSEWLSLTNKLNLLAAQLDFSSVSGNLEIAKYKSNNLSMLGCKEKKVDDTMYENFLPQAYTNIAYDDTGFYEPLNVSGSKIYGLNKDPIPHETLSPKGDKPLKISPKPNVKQKEVSDKASDGSPPPIPRRPYACPPLKPGKMKVLLPSQKTSYDNPAYQVESPPVIPLKPIRRNTPPRIEESLTQPTTIREPEHKYSTGTLNVKLLTISELGMWMADKLGLGNYVAHFKKEMVDGVMLLDLNETILRQEFKLSQIEAKRLMKFAKEGHVPQ
ncbi:hypothetical protein ACJMK2_003885 [Sinanodonta woodiana]|uniref:SAM domain-containing protein n=1 Tax=Sinanodonta woodiana TaxID=1069815 RepID=A0ABD3Y1T8_SINWO